LFSPFTGSNLQAAGAIALQPFLANTSTVTKIDLTGRRGREQKREREREGDWERAGRGWRREEKRREGKRRGEEGREKGNSVSCHSLLCVSLASHLSLLTDCALHDDGVAAFMVGLAKNTQSKVDTLNLSSKCKTQMDKTGAETE
jgi:hypothetical protein